MKRYLWAWLLLFAMSVSVQPARAIDPTQELDQLHHQSWTARDGAPAGVNALAQTPDGFLWLGSPSGLYRFDGLHFERFSPSPGAPEISDDVVALLTVPNGDLWVALRMGGILRIAAGKLSRFGRDQGLPVGSVTALAFDADGTLWASMYMNGLWRYADERWERVGREWGRDDTDKPTIRVAVDGQGTLWVLGGDGMFYLRSGSRKLVKALDPRSDMVGTLRVDRQGVAWTTDPAKGLMSLSTPARRITGRQLGHPVSDGIGNALFDRDGGLWAAREPSVLVRVVDPSHTPFESQTLPLNQPLSGHTVDSMLEDREGNIWIGTTGGLDRFRANKMHAAVPNRDGLLAVGLAAGPGQGLWIGLMTGLMQFDAGKLSNPLMNRPLTHIYRDPQGVLWAGGEGRLWKTKGVKVEAVELPPEIAKLGPSAAVWSMQMDSEGGLWVAFRSRGPNLFRLHDGRWSQPGWAEELLRVMHLTTDAQGRLWIGYGSAGQLAVLEGGHLQPLKAEGPEPGFLHMLVPRGEQVWISGARGVALYRSGRFWPLLSRQGSPFVAGGILLSPQGDLWINGEGGIYRIGAADVKAFEADPTQRVDAEVFDHLQGVQGNGGTAGGVTPSVLAGADGKLWFSRSTNLYWIDPARMLRNPTPPPVKVLALKVDGQVQTTEQPLPAGTNRFEIDYAALSLGLPERVRFRHQLEGVDTQWQDAGGRRQAFYTNVPPGPHTFRVSAANEDGVWNAEGASLKFQVEPHFVQTRGFYALSLAAVAGLLWLLHRLRLQQIAHRLRFSLEARAQERERIARELHDTLLQSTQGLMLSMQAIASGIEAEDPARQRIERALTRAEQVIAEGRGRVHELRVGAVPGSELTAGLAYTADDLSHVHGNAVTVRTRVHGSPCLLQPAALDTALEIGREAMRNAFAHAQADVVEINLHYDAHALRLSVQDNGRGIAEHVVSLRGPAGHWGLQGMRERAQYIGASIEIKGSASSGTCVALSIPAIAAYAEENPRPRRWWQRVEGVV